MNSDIGRFSTAPSTSETEAPAEKPAEEQKPPELVYGSTEEFLHEQLLPTYVRDVDGRAAKWCIEWYFHPEAVSRVAALWRAWEHLRLDPATGMSIWWGDHADHHMRVLLTPTARSTNATCKSTGTPTIWSQSAHQQDGSLTYDSGNSYANLIPAQMPTRRRRTPPLPGETDQTMPKCDGPH